MIRAAFASALLLLWQQAPVQAETPARTSFVHLARNVPGVLYEPAVIGPKAETAVFVMHSSVDYLSFSACTELSQRGYRVLCANNSTSKSGVSNDGVLDQVLTEAGAGVAYLRHLPGVKHVVLLGHSGGGTVMSAYQLVAEGGVKACQSAQLIWKCPDSLAGLPPADGVMLIDSNWGLAEMTLFSIDPAVVDHGLDMFDPANGFRPTGSTYSADFIKRFLSAEGARNKVLLAKAEGDLADIAAGKGPYEDDAPFIVPGASLLGGNNKLFSQDIRLMSHTHKAWPLLHADGSLTTGIVPSVRVPENRVNLSPSLIKGALKTTVRNYLNSYAIRTTPDFSYGEDWVKGIDWTSSYASPPGNVQGISAPLLVMGMTAHWEFLASETVYELAHSRDKTIAFVEGATHLYETCKECERHPGEFGDTRKTTYDYIDGWLSKPGRFDSPIGDGKLILLNSLPASSGAPLQVTSPSLTEGGDLPVSATQYGVNRFPGLSWSKGPAGTRSYAVVLEGLHGKAGAADAGTSLHLVVYNLSAETTALPAGLDMPPPGASYGPNVHGPASGYAGPHPHESGAHPYHLQVFALDTRLASDKEMSFDALKQALSGHVLASGDLLGFVSRPAATSPVKTESGLLTGMTGRDPGITVYKGIPYAAPPVGDLRWRAPAAPLPWEGVKKADSFGPACPQPGGEMARGLPQSEDCLTLNIWSGAKPDSGEKRPVYVWIYGGGFIGGTGASPEFDGEGLAKKGVVVVTFNYRVGVLGFLATPELSRESGHDASGNYGLLDDIAALQWVKRNIASFGGDPGSVTIGGQSAGAGSVGFLALSPLAKGLFRAGIAESHARDPRDPELRYLSISWRPLASAETAGTAYAAQHGAANLAELRALPWQKLIEGSNAIDGAVETGSDGKPPLFRPTVDGWVIPHSYSESYRAGSQNKIRFVAGNNKDESGAVPETAFGPLRADMPPTRAGMPQVNVTLAQFQAAAHRKFGALADEFLKLYPAKTDEEAASQSDASVRDNSRISTFLWGTLWSEKNKLPVHTYF